MNVEADAFDGRRRTCPFTPIKKKYLDRVGAERGRDRRTGWRDKHEVAPYLCPGCGWWHLTSRGAGDTPQTTP